MQISYVPSHVEEYTLTGVLSKFPDNKESHVLQRKYTGLFIELKQGKGRLLYLMFGCRGYLLDNDCYASLPAVLTQIQYGSVARSHQLLRCMGTRLDPIKAGGHIVAPTDFCPAVPKLFTVLPCRPSHLILE